jgi:hypothetical protein
MPALQLLIVTGLITTMLIIVVVCALRLRRPAADHGGRLHVLQLLDLVLSSPRSAVPIPVSRLPGLGRPAVAVLTAGHAGEAEDGWSTAPCGRSPPARTT